MPFYLNDKPLGNSSIPRDGLTLWLDPIIYRSYAGTGTAWNDMSHYGYNTTLVNANSENFHNSIDFDGTGDYAYNSLNYGSSNTIQYCTVLAWIKTTDSGDWFRNWAIIDFDRSEVFNFYTRGDNGKIGLSFDDGGGHHDVYSNTAVNDGNWHQIGFTFTSTPLALVTFYLDGEADGTDTNSGNNLSWGTSQATRYCIIGDGSEATSANGSRNAYYYDGEIAALYFWEGNSSSQLTSKQVRAIFERDRGRFGV